MDADLHKRVAAAVALDHFTSHKMRESDLVQVQVQGPCTLAAAFAGGRAEGVSGQ